jgi:hypothetical protein
LSMDCHSICDSVITQYRHRRTTSTTSRCSTGTSYYGCVRVGRDNSLDRYLLQCPNRDCEPALPTEYHPCAATRAACNVSDMVCMYEGGRATELREGKECWLSLCRQVGNQPTDRKRLLRRTDNAESVWFSGYWEGSASASVALREFT